ncbi:calmodulin-dependent protein kinase [Pelomyxa schiedti]|nr:calmodulin-dependent protein kinase [Pelomyxa schiedti]
MEQADYKSLPDDVFWHCTMREKGTGRTGMAEEQNNPKMFRMLGEFYMRGQGTDPDPIKGRQYFHKAADAGSVSALWDLANCYFTGRGGLPRDVAKSIPFLQRGADSGDSNAMYILGNCFLGGMEVAEDPSKAASLFQKAADLGLADACVDLGELYIQGTGVPIDEKKAISLFQKAVNDPKVGWQAQLNLSDFYLGGLHGVKQDVKKGLSYLDKAVQKGDASGLFRMARCYDLGQGVERNVKKAIKLYQKSVEGGCVTAMYGLSEHYMKGAGVPLDKAEAISLLQQCVQKNDRQGLWRLGRCYDTGEGVEKNSSKAVELYQRAVGRGCSVAMCNLSEHYMNGDGITFDPEQAISLLERSSNLGYTPAMLQLAQYYREGKGVDVDIPKAISLLNQAAETGDDTAMVELSRYYSLGDGVPIDMNRAVTFIRRAHKLRNTEAGIALGWGLLMGAYDMKRDANKAIAILKKAAEESYDAKSMLAWCYECGLGLGKDPHKANTLFKEVIDNDRAESIFKVGALYEAGAFHGPKDVTKAYQLYTRAARAGHGRAQKKVHALLSCCLRAFGREDAPAVIPLSCCGTAVPW